MKGIKVENVQSFRGGLNLRSDPFELANDESPDLLNVDLDPRGGVEQRKGTTLQPVTQANPNLLSSNQATHELGIGWTSPINCTIAQEAAFPIQGNNCLKVTCTVAGICDATADSAVPVTASTVYTAFLQMRSATIARNLIVQINWFNSVGAFISASSSASTVTTTTGYTTVALTATAPVNATQATLMLRVQAAAVGEVFRFDCEQFAKGVNPNLWLNPTTQNVLDSEVQSFVHFQTTTLSQLVASTSAGLWWSTVGTNQWTLLGATTPTSAVQFKDKLYVTHHGAGWSWDGATLTNLATGFNDSLTAPVGTFLPTAKYIAAFQGSVWVANTKESGTVFANRVRFSHPNQPGDWRSFDFFDVDTGLDGDAITGLVPFGDRLLIFKRRSVYAVSGTGPDDFQVYPITQEVGAIDQRAIVNTDVGVFFFSWPEGVFLYDGDTVRRQSERIQPIIDQGNVPASAQGLIRLGWSNRRLWVSVPWRENAVDAAPTVNTRTYVLDPSLSKQGSWTVYGFGVGTMEVLTMASNLQFIGASPGQGFLLLLEDPTVDVPYDTLTTGQRRAVTAYYRTRWIDLGQPAIKKRWKRPDFVVHSLNAQAELPVQLYTDYDPIAIKKRFGLATSQDASVMLWGDVWGETWDLDGQRSERSEVLRGASLGQARAVQLKINGPDPLSFNLLTEEEMKFEGALAWRTSSVDGSVALSSATAFEGTKSLLVTANFATNNIGATPIRPIPVEPGREIGFSFATKAKDVPGSAQGGIVWYDANGILVSSVLGPITVTSTLSWSVITMTATAPVGAVTAVPFATWLGALTTGQGHHVDYAEMYSADSAVGLAWGLNAISFKFIPRPIRS